MAGRQKPDNHESGCCGETLDFGAILWNVVYSVSLLICAITCAFGLANSDWVSNTSDQMVASGIVFDHVKLDTVNVVRCGIMSFCVDAAGNAGDCGFLGPRYGTQVTLASDAITGAASLDTAVAIPYTMWKVAGGFMAFGAFLLFLCFVYSLFACFGFFSIKIQKYSVGASALAGVCILIGLLCWGYSFGDMAVTHCDAQVDGVYNAADKNEAAPCSSYKGLLPSRSLQQPYPGMGEPAGEEEVIGCRICNHMMGPFQPDSNCKVTGIGAICVVFSCVFSFVASAFGGCVKSRNQERRTA